MKAESGFYHVGRTRVCMFTTLWHLCCRLRAFSTTTNFVTARLNVARPDVWRNAQRANEVIITLNLSPLLVPPTIPRLFTRVLSSEEDDLSQLLALAVLFFPQRMSPLFYSQWTQYGFNKILLVAALFHGIALATSLNLGCSGAASFVILARMVVARIQKFLSSSTTVDKPPGANTKKTARKTWADGEMPHERKWGTRGNAGKPRLTSA